jgi:hypothetical protein
MKAKVVGKCIQTVISEAKRGERGEVGRERRWQSG